MFLEGKAAQGVVSILRRCGTIRSRDRNTRVAEWAPRDAVLGRGTIPWVRLHRAHHFLFLPLILREPRATGGGRGSE